MKNRNLKVRSIPKYITLALISILAVFVAIGLFKDMQGEHCPGFMGAKGSCVEEMLFSPFLIVFPLILVFGAMWLTNRIERTDSQQKTKMRRKK